MGDITGTTFAGYEVRDVIGTDLVSALHRATDPEEDRAVTLRVIAQDLCEVKGPDRNLYRRFRSEATASLTFEHSYSPTVEEVGEHHGRGYLVAPFIDTVPLSRYVEEHAPLALDAALELFAHLADVLDSGQANGLAHGAVNPSTLAFARQADGAPDAAYLVGYGIGALLELRLKRDRKQLTVVDDLLYVAPEQLRQQPVTGRTDQYALACALVHVLTGQPPFVRDSIGGLFGAHLFVEPELDTGQAWAVAVRRGMAKEPEARFDTCGELIAAVKAGAASAGATRVIAAPTVAVDVPEPAGRRRGSAATRAVEPVARDQAAEPAGQEPGERKPAEPRPVAEPAAHDPAAEKAVEPVAQNPVAEPTAGRRRGSAARLRASESETRVGPASPDTTRARPGARGAEPDTARPETGDTARSGDPAPQPHADADADAAMVFARSTPPESRNGARPVRFDDDVPLLSEVLSQNRVARGRRGPRLGAVLVAVIAVIAIAVVVWSVLS